MIYLYQRSKVQFVTAFHVDVNYIYRHNKLNMFLYQVPNFFILEISFKSLINYEALEDQEYADKMI